MTTDMEKFNKGLGYTLLVTAVPSVSYRFFEAVSWEERLDLLGYFTIQSNILVIAIVALTLAGINVTARWKIAGGAAIIVTGLIFQLFLRQNWAPQGLSALISNINHGSTTVLYLLWLYFDPQKTELSWNEIWVALPYPAAYCLFGIFESFTRTRPIRYFFLDIQKRGWSSFSLWFAALVVLFLCSGALALLLSRKGAESKREE